MRINVFTGNHGNAHGIADLACLIRNAVRDCGYDVCVSHVLMPGHCNILIENFGDHAEQARLLECKKPGTRFVILATERVRKGSFNHGIDLTHGHYSDLDYWQRRYDGFMLAAHLADVIWVPDESIVAEYAAILPDRPVRFMPHGYVENFDVVRHRDEADKDIDFFFSGSMTEHRVRILKELGKQHEVACAGQAYPDYVRADLMARAKVCLSLRLSPQNTLPSVSRMHFHLQNRNYLVHEAYEGRCALDPFVIHSPAADIVEWARAALEVTNRREVAEAQLARFKAQMPMTRWMRPLLAEAIGSERTARPLPRALMA